MSTVVMTSLADAPRPEHAAVALRAALGEQRHKYRLLEELSASPPGRHPARRDAMRRIAERFPGALREWESLTPGELGTRRASVEALVLEGDACLADRLETAGLRWLRLSILVHTRLREALVARRLSSTIPPTAVGQRLSSRIHEEVALAEGLPVEALKSALFPSSRPLESEETR